jgi:hypothetical protein
MFIGRNITDNNYTPGNKSGYNDNATKNLKQACFTFVFHVGVRL